MRSDQTKLQHFIDQGYISVQQHPTLPLFIYNYTQKAQFDHVWTEETLTCRGLILDSQGNVIARPFRKFFNLDEAIGQGAKLPATDFTITEKMDGSLGILYNEAGTPALATRGSFTSDQAIRGTQILRQRYSRVPFDPEYTHLFEVIYPENRIVVDYGGREDIVLLAAIHMQTGKELSYEELLRRYGEFVPIVKRYDGIRDYTQLAASEEANREGYVIAFPDGQRFKVKFAEYVRLHRLVTGVNARTIWDLLRNDKPFDELLEHVPDEFYQWVKTTRDDLLAAYASIEQQALAKSEAIRDLPTRKDQALALADFEHRGIVFSLLDSKPYRSIIWKLLRPKAERPFTQEI